LGGVTSWQGGSVSLKKPVFNTVAEAVENTGADYFYISFCSASFTPASLASYHGEAPMQASSRQSSPSRRESL